MIPAALQTVLARPDVWHGDRFAWRETLATGHKALDERLGGGWPLGALVECLVGRPGSGEMALWLPALAEATRRHSVAFIAPPFLPYAPGLSRARLNLARVLFIRAESEVDRVWAAVRCLEEGACRIVLLWAARLDDLALRHVQLAAESGSVLAVLFRPLAAGAKPSPAKLRVAVHPQHDGLDIELLKVRGRAPTRLSLPAPLAA